MSDLKEMKDAIGSIHTAREFDRVKQKVVTTMNRVSKPFDQIFTKKVLQLLHEVEAEANQWYDVTE